MTETEPTEKYIVKNAAVPLPEIFQLEHYEVREAVHPRHPNVFLGKHKASGLEVVIKTAVPFFLKDSDPHIDPNIVGKICLCYEHSIQESLNHPNILAPIELYRQNDEFYLITPKVGETDLHPQYRHIISLPEETKLSLLAQTASALAHCKKENIVHLDVKSGNIRVENNQIKLIDFGASRRLGDKHHIIDKIHMSTPDVAAPEHRFDHIITPSADVFSFSCLAYFLLTLQRPFNYIEHFEMLRYKSPLYEKKALEQFGKTGELVIKGMAYKYKERPPIEEITDAFKEEAAKYNHPPNEQPSTPSPVLVQ